MAILDRKGHLSRLGVGGGIGVHKLTYDGQIYSPTGGKTVDDNSGELVYEYESSPGNRLWFSVSGEVVAA